MWGVEYLPPKLFKIKWVSEYVRSAEHVRASKVVMIVLSTQNDGAI